MNRDARTYNCFASCRSLGNILPCRYEIIGVIQEVSTLMGFTSIVCMLDCLTTPVSSFDASDEADLANWSAVVFCSRGIRLSFTSQNWLIWCQTSFKYCCICSSLAS
jgi:hypothetical protein